tara:strand:+ start:2825 stop:3055 length:231 start_codon:yes stop_codon:yes gene_type:complete
MANLIMNSDDLDEQILSDLDEAKVKGSGAVILGAAMLAVGEIIEPEKTSVEITEVSDDHVPDKGLDLNFGDLPPLG